MGVRVRKSERKRGNKKPDSDFVREPCRMGELESEKRGKEGKGGGWKWGNICA